ncbi:MAG TPA: hypothetical protein VGD42_01845 [Lysobacter sp.]
MTPHASAAVRATIATVVGGCLLLVPAINVMIFIGLMLPLWIVSDLGVPGLGEPSNGFFVPSTVGWCLITGTFWAISYVLALGAVRAAAGRKPT